MSYETIRFEVDAGLATLTLARPERLNSFNTTMHAEVRAVLAQLRDDAFATVRCLVLTGAGRAFCAGQDLGERSVAPGDAPVDLGHTIETLYKPLVLGLRGLPVPVIAAVNGVAAGAGANLALACDLVVAARSASFIQSFARIGLVPDCGGTWSLPHAVGTPRAMGLALLGEKLSAEQAEAWGLVWKCVDDDALATTAAALGRQLAAGPPLGQARTKQAIYASATLSLEAALDLERDLQRELGASADYREGVAAFAAKRAPRFTGA